MSVRPFGKWPISLVTAFLPLFSQPAPSQNPPAVISHLSPRVSLPHLSDLMGWRQPMYFTTIQTADIDMDGTDEILARWIDGLHTWHIVNGALIEEKVNFYLGDKQGFTEPSSYSTIRVVRLGRQLRRADIVARKFDGIHTYRYDEIRQQWKELGPDVADRPFPDIEEDTQTDWRREKHYSTIHLGDLDADGTEELIARGRTGIQVFKWDSQNERWHQRTRDTILSDDEGFGGEPYYSSVRLIDIDNDNRKELFARTPGGVMIFRWLNGRWTRISRSGPFQDQSGYADAGLHRSLGVHKDGAGKTWLCGLSGGRVIEVYRWQRDGWEAVTRIRTNPAGQRRTGAAAQLIPANLVDNQEPEFIVTGSDGIQAYTLHGAKLSTDFQPFSHAEGWSLKKHADTIHVARINKGAQSLILGRGRYGLEIYKYKDSWTSPGDCPGNFPCWANDGQLSAYQWISQHFANTDDIRSTYAQYDLRSADWNDRQSSLKSLNYDGSKPISNADYTLVQAQLVTEFGYVSTVRGWFNNNFDVLTDSFNQSPNLLAAARDSLSAGNGDSVGAKWAEFAADIIGKIS